MRDPNLGSVLYANGDPTGITTIEEVVRFLRDREIRIATAIAALAAGHLDPLPAPPKKPRDGDFRYADGINWNPGGGRGIYFFDNVGWNKLG